MPTAIMVPACKRVARSHQPPSDHDGPRPSSKDEAALWKERFLAERAANETLRGRVSDLEGQVSLLRQRLKERPNRSPGGSGGADGVPASRERRGGRESGMAGAPGEGEAGVIGPAAAKRMRRDTDPGRARGRERGGEGGGSRGSPPPVDATVGGSDADERGEDSADERGGGASPGNGTWNARLGQLRQFRETNGHCDVGRGGRGHSALYQWLCAQRREYRRWKRGERSSLTDERREGLEGMGVMWDPPSARAQLMQAKWEGMLGRLRSYKERTGHCIVERTEMHTTLYNWLSAQRSEFRKWKRGDKSSLTDERREALEELGVEWDVASTLNGERSALKRQSENKRAAAKQVQWEYQLDLLRKFKESHGHLEVPVTSKRLRSWMDNQRHYFRRKQEGKKVFITDARIAMLNELGFDWNAKSTQSLDAGTIWRGRMEELRNFREKNKHLDVPEGSSLHNWMQTQRANFRKGERNEQNALTDERKAALDELGFVWKPISKHTLRCQKLWDDSYEKLRMFKQQHGHLDAPRDTPLFKWITTQRKAHRQKENGQHSTLTEERKCKLDGLGFVWEPATKETLAMEEALHRRLESLRKFKDAYGHMNVPKGDPLHSWMRAQRESYMSWKKGQNSSLTN